ncbi:MAG TPA: hypothetical protein VHB79_25640 [Polyangiaceae bacterium]|nr:hypothetical protein [Polyangiaceae bacterium]
MLLLAVLSGHICGCDGAFVNLGGSEGALTAGNAGTGVAAGGGGVESWRVSGEPLMASDSFQLSNPTLTADQQQIYYTQQALGDAPPTLAVHATFDGQKLGGPSELSLTTDRFGVGSLAVSADGSELWFSRFDETSGQSDIWRSVGQGDSWDPAMRVPELSTPFDDSPRPPAVAGTIMPLSSKPEGSVLMQIYFATRGSDGTWSAPNQDHLALVNSPKYLSADGFLTEDGLSLYFASKRDGNSNLYVAHRASLDGDFDEPAPLSVNTPSEERMPWLSADERTMYFVSDQLGTYALYVATRE